MYDAELEYDDVRKREELRELWARYHSLLSMLGDTPDVTRIKEYLDAAERADFGSQEYHHAKSTAKRNIETITPDTDSIAAYWRSRVK